MRHSACSPRSSVRMRMTSSTFVRKIFPSPIFPVRADFRMASTTVSTRRSTTTSSTFVRGSRSMEYSRPRYTSVWPFCRPRPRTSVTVMPSIPASFSASFTASNREVWMIASIFVIARSGDTGNPALCSACLRFQGVALFAVLRQVQPFDFLLRGHAQAKQHVRDLQDDQASHNGEHPGNDHADQLVQQPARVPLQQAHGQRGSRFVVKQRIYRAAGEDAGEQRTECPASAVNAKGVQ